MALGQDGAHGMILCVDQFATKWGPGGVQLDLRTDQLELIARKTLVLSDACYFPALHLRVGTETSFETWQAPW